MKLPVVKLDAKKAGDIEVSDSVFGISEIRSDILQRMVRYQLSKRQAGTHSTQNRDDVSVTTKKLYRQKGTGNARQGSIRAPQMTGGGIVHGPKPRDYAQRTPKKMIAAALAGALSDRVRGERVHIVDSFGIEGTPSTKAAAAFIADVAPSKHVLVVLERDDEVGYKSLRNLVNVHVLAFDQLNAYDVLVSDDIVFTKGAYDAFVSSKTGAARPLCPVTG